MEKSTSISSLILVSLLAVISISCSSSRKVATNGGVDYYNLQPEQGKAVVYILRPSTLGFAIPMNIECDGKVVGTNLGKNFIYFMADPGEHTVISYAENNDELKLNIEAGKVYYVLQKVKMGVLMARCKLELMDVSAGKSKLVKCNLSKRQPK